MAATRADVARMAGVSASTVSYVLSGARPISDATRRRVLAAIDELGYIPNALAQGLARSWRGMIGLHWPIGDRAISSTESEYIAAVTEVARRRGFHLLLWSNPIDDSDGLRFIASQGMVDGVILMEVLNGDPRIPVLDKLDVRYVLVGRDDARTDANHVDADFAELGERAIEYAAGRGHGIVAFLSQTEEIDRRGYGPVTRMRQALESAAPRHGVSLHTMYSPLSIRGGRAAFARLSQEHPDATCVIEVNEPATIGLLEAAAAAGRAVPARLSVIALNQGRAAAEMAIPALTDVSARPAVIATRAVNGLIDLVEGASDVPIAELVASVLTERDSVADAVAPSGDILP